MSKPVTYNPSEKALGKAKLARIPIKIEMSDPPLAKPDWIRIRLSNNPKVEELKELFREKRLVTVCEEAACPNLNECFSHGTATFMIMGDKCTRRCSFCDVGHGRPDPLNPDEPYHLAQTVNQLNLKYVVITSVDRDDLRDGGASHFSRCIAEVRNHNPGITVEVLVPDFRGRMEKALVALAENVPDVFNHNIETVPSLYPQTRIGADYSVSLTLLKRFKQNFPNIPTKSGMMLGLGETFDEIKQVLEDLREHQVDRLTLGQYLQPTRYHMPVKRYVPPQEFSNLAIFAQSLGFTHVASGPLVRSSYHADLQARGEIVT